MEYTLTKRTYQKKGIWQERVREFLNSGLPIQAWCLQNEIHRKSLCYWMTQFRKQGVLPELYDWAAGFQIHSSSKTTFFTLDIPGTPGSVHFAAAPVDQGSFDQLYWCIHTAFSHSLQIGDSFLFLRRDRKRLYTIRKNRGGFCFIKGYRERGTFHWPTHLTENGVSNITKTQLEELLSMASIPWKKEK